jgi:hypothetical protein
MTSEVKIFNHLKKEIGKPLSNYDIERALNNKVKIIIYSDIKKMRDENEFFKPHNMVCVLYETGKEIGHWILLIKHNKGNKKIIEFFDPYGQNLDEPLEFSVKRDKYPYLMNLFYRSGINDFIWNNMKLQRLENGINTCGRWCILRGLNRNICLDCFQKEIMNSGYYPKLSDLYVYLMTQNV